MLSITGPSLMALRRLTRLIGVNALAGRFLALRGYEARVWDTIAGAVKPGDCVWDIGANIGFYSTQFGDLAGPTGTVVAFEPSPENRVRLEAATASYPMVRVLPVGLSDADGTARLIQGDDDLGATSRISGESSATGNVHEIELAAGDHLVAQGKVPAPNIVKIDVEGHELSVLGGMRATLANGSLRHAFIEVHFRLLEAQGLSAGARTIESLLREKGFKLRWLDPSHLHAYRDAKA